MVWANLYQARYLCGVVAGLFAQSIGQSHLGYLAGWRNTEALQNAGAFTLGVRSVIPQATVDFRYINSECFRRSCASQFCC